MKLLRITASVDLDAAGDLVALLAGTPGIAEVRLLDWNRLSDAPDTVLYAIDGDADQFRERASETPGVASVELAAVEEATSYALVEARPLSMPMIAGIHRASTRCGIVVLKPIVYRDGEVTCRVVGEPEPLQASLDRAPDPIDVRIDAISAVGDGLGRPESILSDRQREAIEAALALGYYDRPRGATHEDVAALLGCSATTASEHLQKAEAKLVRTAMSEFGPARSDG